MKKNAIAVLLSIVLTLGNVGVVPAYAADTPTINKEAEISEESPIEEDSAVEEEPASQDEIEFSGDTSETESENANKDSANAEQDDEESEKDSGQKAEEIDNEEEQEKGQLTPQDTDSDADESAEENEVELSDETSKSAELQIDEESAFFLGKEFRIEGSSEVISFQEVNGEIIATWRKSNGYFSWPLYVTWDIPGKKFSQILSQYGASGYGLLSQNDISGATFKGVIRDDGKWSVSIYNAQGNRCVGNTFSLVDLNGWDTLVLEESYKCVVGDVISVKGIFHTNELQVNASYEVSDSEALILSNKKVLSPNETGEENTWFIEILQC